MDRARADQTSGEREAFWLSKTEVTQAEYEALMGTNPSEAEYEGVSFRSGRYPVQNVSWLEAVAYANARSKAEGLTPAYRISGEDVTWDRSANGYRLPTEAEWEYAARAGTSGAWGAVKEAAGICAVGNIADATAKAKWSNWSGTASCTDGVAGLAAVGSFPANPWGLHDMVGNVLEWTWDRYADSPSGESDPSGPTTGSYRVVRGGSCGGGAALARVAFRAYDEPGNRYSGLGFRLARSIP